MAISEALRKKRLRQSRYYYKLKALGFLGGQVPSARLSSIKCWTRWHKAHWALRLKADAKYRNKIREKYGTYTNHTRWLYAQANKLKRLKAAKMLLAGLYSNDSPGGRKGRLSFDLSRMPKSPKTTKGRKG